MPRKAKRFGSGDKPKRQSRSKEGYDRAWYKFRDWYASEHPAICVGWPSGRKCGAALASHNMHLDHIVEFTGIDDPRRLDETNVQWLCRSCHSRKTAAKSGFGS